MRQGFVGSCPVSHSISFAKTLLQHADLGVKEGCSCFPSKLNGRLECGMGFFALVPFACTLTLLRGAKVLVAIALVAWC